MTGLRPARIAALLAAFTAALALEAGSLKRVYIAPDDHTDYVWSADEETYRQVFLEMIDHYLDEADRTASYPPEHRSRWNCDGSLWMWTYEKNKTPEQFERFLGRLRDGHFSVPLNAVASCYGGQPLEAVLRGMYYPGRIERRTGLRFPLAVAMENQTLPYGLGGLFAGSGARWSWRGICGCASKLAPVKHTLRPHEIYWWQAPDGSRILMKWNSLLKNSAPRFDANKCIGGYAEAFNPALSLEFIETDGRFRKVWPYSIAGLFGKGWDHLKTLDDETVALARKASTAERRIIVSNEEDFFRDFEATHGKDLPAFNAAFGNEWDLYIASVAEMSGRVRRAVERLRTAEALASLVSLKRPQFLNGREPDRDLAFLNLGLFWEHNWTGDGPVLRTARAAWGRKLAAQIEGYVEALDNDAAYALGQLIPKTGAHRRFYVFNPLGWTRTDVADLPWDGPAEARVVDPSSGAEVPSQMVLLDWNRYTKGRRHIRVLAKDIPPVGYRVFEIRPGAPAAQPDAAAADGGVFENALYRLKVEGRGAIASLVDKTRGGRELARAIDGRAINDIGLGEGRLTVENRGPVSVTLRADVAAPLARATRITLYRDVNRIAIENEIKQNFSEVLSWSFGFNLDAPDVWHEEVGAVIRARLAADGGHYSPVHSRLDWLTLNHFASMSGASGAGVTLSNADLAFFRLGESAVVDGVSRLDTATPQISVLAGGQVDGARLGVPSQGGDAYFLQRFALQSYARFEAPEAMRFALEHQNPLRAALITGGPGPGYPETSYSLLSIDDPQVLLWAVKPAEEGIGEGVIARMWNLSRERRKPALRFEPGLKAARRTTHIETDLGAAAVSGGAAAAELGPQQVATYRLRSR